MKDRSNPMRRCIGCMQSKEKSELIRIAGYEGKLTVDTNGSAKGRGVYICKNHECIEKAKKRKAIQRSIKMETKPEDVERIFEELTLELTSYEEKRP